MLSYRHNVHIIRIWIFFLYEFKLNHNVADAAKNINKAFGDDKVKERTISDDCKNSDRAIWISKMDHVTTQFQLSKTLNSEN